MTSAAIANPTAADDREYIAGLRAETERLLAETQRINAQATHLGALNTLALHASMRRSDEFHARHPWVKYALMGSAALGWLVVGFAAGVLLWR